MNDVEGSSCHLSQVDRSYVSFACNSFIFGHIVIPCISLTFCQVFLDEAVVYVSVFCVYTYQCADLCSVLQSFEELTVIYAEIINHEYFKGGYASLNAFIHGSQHFRSSNVTNTDVVRVVDCRTVSLTNRISSFQSSVHSFANTLKNEVEYCSSTTTSSSSCTSEVVISSNCSTERHCQVSVTVDSARQDHLTLCINNFSLLFRLQVCTDCTDLSVFNCNVCFKR